MVIDPDKLQFNSVDRSHVHGSRFYGLAFVSIFTALLIWGGMYLSNSDTLPIKQVRIEGDFTHLSPVDLHTSSLYHHHPEQFCNNPYRERLIQYMMFL